MNKNILFAALFIIVFAVSIVIDPAFMTVSAVLATAPVVASVKRIREDGTEEEVLEMSKEQLNAMVEAAISRFSSDKGLLDLIKKNTPEEIAKAERERNPSYVFSKMLSCMLKNDKAGINEIRLKADPTPAQTEGTDSEGGYFVPDVTSSEVLRLIPTFNQGMELFRKIPMGKAKKIKIPTAGTGVTVTWVDEKEAIPPSAGTFSDVTLEVKKLAGIAVMSNELIADANIDIGNYLLSLFAEAFGTELDRQFYQGTGTVFDGLCHDVKNWGNIVNVSDLSQITFANVIDVVYGIDQNYLKNAVWQMHRLVLGKLRKLVDSTTGVPLFFPASQGMPATLLDFPIKIIEAMPTTKLNDKATAIAVLGNPLNSIIGTKTDMSMTLLKESVVGDYNLGTMDMSAIRVIMRIAFNKGIVKGNAGLVIPE